MRPIAHARDEAVLQRVDVTIFDVARIVGLTADEMLPEPPLPDAALVAGDANGVEPLILRQCSCEPALDQAPARGEIVIAGWQRPDRMQMIGQHDEGVDREGMALTRRSDGL